MKFPDEDEAIAEIRSGLAREFDFAERILSFWFSVKHDEHVRKSSLDKSVETTAFLLNTQACRQYRSSIERCQRAEAASARVDARCLLETVLATGWILKPDVRVAPTPSLKDDHPRTYSNGKTKYKVKVEEGVDIAPRELRAQLLQAYSSYRLRRYMNKANTIPQPDWDSELAGLVGDKWASVIQERRSYSGLNIQQLATELGEPFSSLYESQYPHLSAEAHSNNFVQHFDLVEVTPDTIQYFEQVDPTIDLGNELKVRRWFSSVEEVSVVIQAATFLFLFHLVILQDQIDFGGETAHELEDLFHEHNHLFVAGEQSQ